MNFIPHSYELSKMFSETYTKMALSEANKDINVKIVDVTSVSRTKKESHR